MAARWGWGLLFVAVSLGFLQESSTYEVKDDHDKICILANFSVLFTVEYNIKDKKESKTFPLPESAKVLKNSTCNKGNSSVLAIGFSTHSLEMTFERSKGFYSINNLTFRYNLSDALFFPNSTKGGIQEATAGTDVRAGLNTTYRCINKDRINMTNVVIFLSNVTLEAYLPNNTFSPKLTICCEDGGSTVAPVTTSTPTTSHAPTTPPHNPNVGTYNVTGSGGICLLASMGLQLNVTYLAKDKLQSDVLNLPTTASHSGSCDNNTIFLNLTSGNTRLSFRFAQNTSTEKYFLQGIVVSTRLPPGAARQDLSAFNNSLSALKASVGKSYKCRAEESIWVTSNASLNIFDVQIQAFKIEGGNFGAVEECQLDENNMLIPIIVGAALAGLVLIVLIAYLIGRKRSHAGYQTI
ncbi:lysosome-associated membrane glycoprotein 1 [Tiliqua scincoides]|uniref:lysosome-associated membrane glycoprotein 1 n=1 Tax=Tiliqua scincoides TaxID=71010 RepID=UPI003461A8B3